MVNVIRTPRETSSSPRAAEVGEIDTRAPFQSVKAAVSLFGETISTPPNLTKQTFFKKSKSIVEGVIDKEAEYHFAQKELGKCKSQVSYAESAANKALPELEKAMKTLLDLKEKLKSVNACTQSIIEDTEALKMKAKELEEEKSTKDEKGKVGNGEQVNACRQDYKVVVAELDTAKQELSNLHGDLEEAMGARLTALEMAEQAELAMKTHTEKITQLSQEIERMKESLNEVHLSTQYTLEQHAKISAEREEKESGFRVSKEQVDGKKAGLLQEMEGVEIMDMKLAKEYEEIEVVKGQIEEAKASLSDSQRHTFSQLIELKKVERENQSLQKAVNDLKLELENVGKEIGEVKSKEVEAEDLNSYLKVELQERKKELETTFASQGDDSNACNEMVMKLEQLLLETKNARKEAEEMNMNIEEMRRQVMSVKEMTMKLELAIKEAEEAKVVERNTQNELRILRETSEVERAEGSTKEKEGKNVSKEEYVCLKEKASESNKLAETKLTSAIAEMEALNANKNAAEMKLQQILTQIEEIDKATEEAFKQAEMADAAKSMVESELKRRREEHDTLNVVVS